ncbi:MAG: hypothetical protein PSV18_01045 [Methylobacter sp.]|uniref:Uncharacterized protein n=1 Tax=Candidatus Methylobacter titanis TaxID=3053457 RepID=A0AA43TK99_9GAMM|nr:hypothetical protein [Candidatus Methylobacter titanis]MDI1291318.1 hypothetical protein [Candidatus Methylobacter titanis]
MSGCYFPLGIAVKHFLADTDFLQLDDWIAGRSTQYDANERILGFGLFGSKLQIIVINCDDSEKTYAHAMNQDILEFC